MRQRACCRCSMATFEPFNDGYENKARLYFVRLLDSSRVAIEVGRERMGTDKRPGTIDLTRNRKTTRVFDQRRRRTRRSQNQLCNPPMIAQRTYPRLRRPRRPRGSRFASVRAGTEYVYHGERAYRRRPDGQLAVANRRRSSISTCEFCFFIPALLHQHPALSGAAPRPGASAPASPGVRSAPGTRRSSRGPRPESPAAPRPPREPTSGRERGV